MLNRLIVAAVLLFAYAECQYASFNNYGGYGVAGGYGGLGAGYGGAGYGGLGGYGGYGYGPRNYQLDPFTGNKAGGNDYTVSKPGGGISTVAYGTNQFPIPYYPSGPYQGSPFGYPDYYPRNYADMYGNFYPQGPPPPPPYSGGVPFGYYEPDTYASGLPPPFFKPDPIGRGLTPINGYPGALAPNPYFIGDADDIPYKVFQRLYKEQYGSRYEPGNAQIQTAVPRPDTPQFNYPAPGTNYFGYNVGLVPNYGSTGAMYRPLPSGGYGNFNGYGQPATTPSTPTQPGSSTSTPPSNGGGAAPAP